MADDVEVKSDSQPAAVRFLDAFFQEQNIKWLLGLGTLILLGSSTMLVVSHWDSYPPLWKSLILFGYTVAIHVSGQVAFHRLSLRKTGIALMALTVLLIPLGFLAIRWIHPEGLALSAVFSQFGMLALLAANAALAWLAGSSIFSLLLRKPQPTLVASYLLLSAAGAILPALPAQAAPATAVFLWGVFTVGAIKSNRHVFWLTEELRLPRIFGFFPIALLGMQYLLLFTLGVAAHLAWGWIGLGLVLTAIPILLTANAVAAVFEARNTRLDSPYPASIVLPIVLGLMLIVGGVCLSGIGYPATVALVPTAACAALLLAVTAARTGQPGFVWGALVLATVAYQTSPVFFKELARTVVQEGAAAVNESRLPLAFYGLTYLPWLALLTGAAHQLQRRSQTLFATPIRQFVTVVPGLLLLAAGSHPKACFPVGLALTGLIAIQLFLFHRPGLVWPMLAGLLLTTAGVPTFTTDILGFTGFEQLPALAWLTTATLLLGPGMWLDRKWNQLSVNSNESAEELVPCQLTSLVIVLTTAVCWIGAVCQGMTPWPTGVLCAALLFGHSFAWRQHWMSVLALVYSLVLILVIANTAGWSFTAQFTLAIGLLAGLSGLGRWLESSPEWSVSRIYAGPATGVAAWGILGGLLILIPWMALSPLPVSPFAVVTFDAWVAVGVALIVAVELSWRTAWPGLVTLAWGTLLSLSCLLSRNLLGQESGIEMTPLVWSLLAVVLIPGVKFLGNRLMDTRRGVIREWEVCLGLTLIAVATLGLPVLTGVLRLAGLVSLAGAFWLLQGTPSPVLGTLLLVIGNAHLLVGVVQFCHPELKHLGELTPTLCVLSSVPVALVSVLSSLFWERRRLRERQDVSVPSLVLQGLAVVSLMGRWNSGLPLWGLEAALLMVSFVVLTVLHVWLALRATPVLEEQGPGDVPLPMATAHVWFALVSFAVGLLFLVRFQVLPHEGRLLLFLPLVLSLVACVLHRLTVSRVRFRAFVSPLLKVALALPMVTVAVAGHRHLFERSSDWLGLNSLALLLAAAVYFWHGLERSRTASLFGSAAILNFALAILWRELQWSDPQLFLVPIGLSTLALVELLQQRIPREWHNPLRYAGALTILVSPTFHIVGGSWLHLITLMVASLAIVLLAMGLRVKVLMYTGTAFLLADLLAIVVRGTFDQPSLLWFGGIIVGVSVITLAAYCERHREQLLQRIRLLTAQLETWR